LEQREVMSVAESTHYRWADIQPEAMTPLVSRQYLTGMKMTLARIVLKKGARVPQHRHFNEQMCHVLSGALMFALDEGEMVVRGGEILCIAPNASHEVYALEDSVALDIFSPPRQDWIDGDDAYLRGAPEKLAS
jgi:quercetin dioxygenase-like cupin family protein